MDSQPHFVVVGHALYDALPLDRAFKSGLAKFSICRNISEAKAYLSGAGAYKDRNKYPFPIGIISEMYPGGDPAMQFLRWVRSCEDTRDLPFFFIVNVLLPARKAQAQSFTDVHVYRKPADPTELASLLRTIIRQVLERRRELDSCASLKSPPVATSHS